MQGLYLTMLFCRELPKLYLRIADQTSTAAEINRDFWLLKKQCEMPLQYNILFIHFMTKVNGAHQQHGSFT